MIKPDVITYTPSPLEIAFAQSIKNAFQVDLSGATVHERQLVRVTPAIDCKEGLLSFHYRRQDPLENGPFLIYTSLELLDFKDEDFDEERFKAILRQRVVERDGRFDPVSALINPSYYSVDHDPFQWPEEFSFFLMDKKKQSELLEAPKVQQINGEMPIDEQLTHVHAVLAVSSGFLDSPYLSPQVELKIAHPSLAELLRSTRRPLSEAMADLYKILLKDLSPDPQTYTLGFPENPQAFTDNFVGIAVRIA